MIMRIVLYALMILAAAGMLYGNNKYKAKGVAWGRPLAGACGVFALIMAVFIMGLYLFGGKARINSIIEKELQYFDYKMQYLASHLAEKHPGASYLLITNQKTEYNEKRHQVMMDGLAKAGINVAHIHEVMPPEEMGEMMEADLFLTAEKFDKIIEKYSDVDMVISTLGLPMDYRDMRIWNLPEWKKKHKGAEPPKLVLVDAYVYDLKKAIKVGMIAAVVQYRPDAQYKPDEDVPSNVTEAFEKRYILITPENVDEMSAKYEGLFMEDAK